MSLYSFVLAPPGKACRSIAFHKSPNVHEPLSPRSSSAPQNSGALDARRPRGGPVLALPLAGLKRIAAPPSPAATALAPPAFATQQRFDGCLTPAPLS